MVTLPFNSKSPQGDSGGFKREPAPDRAVIRVDKQAGRWEAIPRTLIEDDRLSLEARWFAIWLASRSDHWEIRAGALPQLLKDLTRRNGHVGRDTTKRLLRELENSGYLVRTRTRRSGGRWVWLSSFRAVQGSRTTAGSTIDGTSVDGRTVNGKSGDTLHTDYSTLNQSTLTTTTADGTAERQERVVASVVTNEIRFPRIFEGAALEPARALLGACPTELRQAVLDEIAAMAAAKPIRSPLGLLHRLIERAHQGRFTPNLSIRTSPQAAPAQINCRRAEVHRGDPSPTPVVASTIAIRALANIRQKVE